MKKIGVVGVLLFFLMNAIAVPAVAAKEEGETAQTIGIQIAALEPVKAPLAKLGAYLPKLGGLLLILIIGVLIAVGVAYLIERLLEVIRLEEGAKKIKIPEILKKGGIKLSLSELIGEIVFFLIIIGTLIAALGYYGVGTSAYMSQILSYIPNVIAATFILILGILAAILISGIVTLVGGNVRIAQSEALIVAGLLALKELGLEVILTDTSKDIILGGIILALALAFGLGAKDRAGKFLDKMLK